METLGIIVKVDGTLEASNGLKLTGEAAKNTGKNLDGLEQAAQKTTSATGLLASATRYLAGAVAGVSLLNLIRESAMLSSRYETMGVVMRIAGNNAGYTGAEMNALALTLQESGISMLESRNSLTQLATANIDLASATKLGRAAQDLAVVGNVNSSEALNRLIYGVKSGQVEVLRTIGLNVSFEGSYKKLADQLGVSTASLSENQKVQARTNVVIEEAARYNGIYEESMTTAGKAMGSLTRHWENFKVQAGDAFLPTLATSVFTVTDALKAMNTELARAGQDGLIDNVAQALNGTLKTGLEATAVLGANVAFVLKSVGQMMGAIVAVYVRVAQLDFSGARAIGKALEEDGKVGRAALDAFEKKILGVGEASKKVATMSEVQRIAEGQKAKAASEAADKQSSQNAALLDFTRKYGTEAQKAKIATDEWRAKLGELYTPELAAKLNGKFTKPDKGGGGGRAPAEDNAAETYIAGLNKQMRAASGEASAYSTVLEHLTLNSKKFTSEQYETVVALGLAIDEQNKLREQTQANLQATKDLADAEHKRVQALESGLSGMTSQNQAMKDEIELLGLSKLAQHTVTQARLSSVIAIKEEQLARMQNTEFMGREQIALEEEIRLMKEKLGLSQARADKTDEADKTKAAEDYSRKFGEDVRRDLKNGLIRGMEDGKTPARALGDTLGAIVKERLFSAFADSILNGFEPLIKQVMERIQLPSGAGGAGGGGGGFLSSIFNSILGGGVGTDIIPQGVAASASGFGGGGMMDSLASFGVFHSGGMAGGSAPASRTASSALWKGAQRFHGGGLASNERPVIVDKTEGIFTRDQMAALAPAGGGAAPTINIYTPAGMKAETKQRKGADGGMNVDVMISAVEDALADRVGSGSGALYGAMSDRFGLRTQVG